MSNANKLILAAILLAAASMLSFDAAIKQKAPDNDQNTDFILYYGATCPHCETVENYIAENDLAEKLQIEQKEVSSGRTNRDEFIQIAQNCGLGAENLGVPMLWDGKTQKCYSGDETIIDFLKQANAKQPL